MCQLLGVPNETARSYALLAGEQKATERRVGLRVVLFFVFFFFGEESWTVALADPAVFDGT